MQKRRVDSVDAAVRWPTDKEAADGDGEDLGVEQLLCRRQCGGV